MLENMPIDIVDGTRVRDCLLMPACIRLMRDTMVAIYQHKTVLPQRLVTPLLNNTDYFAAMPGAMLNPAVSGAKLVTLYPHNPVVGRPAIQGLITLFDLETGEAIALVDAATITAIRTAAASAAATQALAREGARILLLLGYGVQAHTHLEAMIAVRPIDQVMVWGRSFEKAQAFAAREQKRINIGIEAVANLRCAVQSADIICTLTGSHHPIIEGEWLRPGVHLNLVGAHSPTTREVDSEAIKRSRLFVEIKKFTLQEAGDILIPLREGAFNESHILAEIAQVFLGEFSGRQSETDITAYKSLGNTAQDLAAAYAALTSAKRQGKTSTVEFKSL